jgi:hypothetical protein
VHDPAAVMSPFEDMPVVVPWCHAIQPDDNVVVASLIAKEARSTFM